MASKQFEIPTHQRIALYDMEYDLAIGIYTSYTLNGYSIEIAQDKDTGHDMFAFVDADEHVCCIHERIADDEMIDFILNVGNPTEWQPVKESRHE